MTRRSISLLGISPHSNPVPLACVIGNILVTSALMGQEPGTGVFPEDKLREIANAFEALKLTLAAAGASLSDVIKLDLYFADKADRELVNPHWLALFPDETSRPARHALLAILPESCHLQIVAMAVIGAAT
jgi:2-iminobutanoate/2-iminopropanoate deaminase